jgi:hypothetical protein
MCARDVEEIIVTLYPATLAVCICTPLRKDNINKVASRLTRVTRIPPSIMNFTHVDLAMTWQVKSYAHLCYCRALALKQLESTPTANMMTVSLAELAETAHTASFFFKFGVQRALAVKMFKTYVSETDEEFRCHFLLMPNSCSSDETADSPPASPARWSWSARECYEVLSQGSRDEQLAYLARIDIELEHMLSNNTMYSIIYLVYLLKNLFFNSSR